MSIREWIVTLLQGGLGNLAVILAAHVLLCLLPAIGVHVDRPSLASHT